MKERPILMSGPMVRAILEGRKLQTRRVIKINGVAIHEAQRGEAHLLKFSDGIARFKDGLSSPFIPVRCPHGQPGDWLWVKETFATDVPGCPGGVTYRADHHDPDGDGPANPIRWRPSIHMPRRASRITLEITGVRVERLQDISEADASAEGRETQNGDMRNAREWFADLWDSIYAKRGYGWWVNPWVFVVEFKRIENEAG